MSRTVSDTASAKVGIDVSADAVLEVAARLRVEALKKVDDDPTAAMLATRQSFQLQQQYDHDAGELCAACAAVCRVQRRLAAPRAPAAAVDTLCSALDTLDAWAARDGPVAGAEVDFLWRELWGLSRSLCAADQIGAPTLEALRAADRCLERIAAVGLRRPLLIETSSLGDRDNEVRLTAEEILFQQADIAQRSADACITQSNSAPAEMRQRDREAATFFLNRAVRKIKLAGATERDPVLRDIRARIEALEAAPVPAPAAASAAPAAAPAAPTAAAADDGACVIS